MSNNCRWLGIASRYNEGLLRDGQRDYGINFTWYLSTFSTILLFTYISNGYCSALQIRKIMIMIIERDL